MSWEIANTSEGGERTCVGLTLESGTLVANPGRKTARVIRQPGQDGVLRRMTGLVPRQTVLTTTITAISSSDRSEAELFANNLENSLLRCTFPSHYEDTHRDWWCVECRLLALVPMVLHDGAWRQGVTVRLLIEQEDVT